MHSNDVVKYGWRQATRYMLENLSSKIEHKKPNKQAFLNTKSVKVHLKLIQISDDCEPTFASHAHIRHKK